MCESIHIFFLNFEFSSYTFVFALSHPRIRSQRKTMPQRTFNQHETALLILLTPFKDRKPQAINTLLVCSTFYTCSFLLFSYLYYFMLTTFMLIDLALDYETTV